MEVHMGETKIDFYICTMEMETLLCQRALVDAYFMMKTCNNDNTCSVVLKAEKIVVH